MAKKLLPKIGSLGELRRLAINDIRYRRLALAASANLGRNTADLGVALAWLSTNANEGDEAGVVDEVNFVRDCI
jgi:hypothetical protein